MKKKHRLLKLILFILAVCGILYLINEILARLAARKQCLPEDDGEFFDWNGKQVYFETAGSGKPLLLLHDLTPASSAYEWNAVRDELARKHTVYSVDLPGCGRSARDEDDYIGYYYVQFLNAFIREKIGKKVDLAATGTSALIALSAAAFHTDMADRLILINPGSEKNWPFRDSLKPFAAVALRLPILGRSLYNLLYSKLALTRLFIDKQLYNPYRLDDSLVDAYYEGAHLAKSNGRYLLSSILNGDMVVDPSLALKKLRNPILILNGQALTEMQDAASDYQKARDDIKVETIADVRQLPQIEEPEVFLRSVEDFLATDES